MSVIMKILLFMLSYWMNFKPELHFLENINVQNGKAETITTAVNLLMERRNLHKIAGFGSDGASVMTGKNWSFKTNEGQ